jgi:ABC-2 type transport system ATP-binding protein
MNQFAIEAEGLTRYFGTRCVVDDVSFQLKQGTVTGLLGLNGAGKTTTLRMLMGFLEPTSGYSSILGADSRSFTPADRARIGYSIEGHFFYRSQTVANLEQLQKETFPVWNARLFQDILERFKISPSRRASELSRGQRAGVSLALTLCSEPQVLLLDDPALGLDPVARRSLNETMLDYVQDGERTILLSSHLLDDIERIVDDVIIMLDSRIVAHCTPAALQERVTRWQFSCDEDVKKLPKLSGLLTQHCHRGRWTISIEDCRQETIETLRDLGGDSLQQIDTAFGECVIAYLSSQRSDESFLSAAAPRTHSEEIRS